MLLYRPVGLEELILIYDSGMRSYPPRLPEQPIFYPVLNELYATQIAQNWNTTSGTFAGYVTEFEIDDAYGGAWEVHQVGAREHVELWIPAETLDEFNDHVVGQIRLLSAFFGPQFSGLADDTTDPLEDTSAPGLLCSLWNRHATKKAALRTEVERHHDFVFAYYPFWNQRFTEHALAPDIDAAELLSAIRDTWHASSPGIPLGVQKVPG